MGNDWSMSMSIYLKHVRGHWSVPGLLPATCIKFSSGGMCGGAAARFLLAQSNDSTATMIVAMVDNDNNQSLLVSADLVVLDA
jgi:hypothetical protein